MARHDGTMIVFIVRHWLLYMLGHHREERKNPGPSHNKQSGGDLRTVNLLLLLTLK